MADEPLHTASAGYAVGRLLHALETAAHHTDPDVRRRAADRMERWRAVVQGMEDGSLSVGSRTPVADTPAWVTLEVAQGGFATGRYLAEGPVLDHEVAVLTELPDGVPGATERERLNNWYLSDGGQKTLAEALQADRLHITLPEEGALPIAVWLLENEHECAALDLIDMLRPLFHRLRFYPELRSVPRPQGAVVRLLTVREVSHALRVVRPKDDVATMNEALGIWNPLYDRLVALWLRTVDGPPPSRDNNAKQDGKPSPIVGGWPCRSWPADWTEQRQVWLAAYATARSQNVRCHKHQHPKSNFTLLREALEHCSKAGDIEHRDVARVRLALANTIAHHGLPDSPERRALRAEQATTAERPTYAELARVMIRRMKELPAEGGLPTLDPITAPVEEREFPGAGAGVPLPKHLAKKAERALEAPVDELVERGVIGSAEVLAIVLPQITAQISAAGIEEPTLRGLYQQVYAAFRRRRSLLLLNLEHQVRLEELPWIFAIAPLRKATLGSQRAARQTLEQVTMLALSSFPHTLLPNPLVRELSALATQAGLDVPLVEELAADIFMGVFTTKWAHAARDAAVQLQGTVYARYYGLSSPEETARWDEGEPQRWGKPVARQFTKVCQERAREATTGSGSGVAANGAVIEQSQILTTHNLASLVRALALEPSLRSLSPDLAERTLAWVVERQQQHAPRYRARLQMLKNTAYAWRQAIYFLSFCDVDTSWRIFERIEALVAKQPELFARRFAPVLDGLRLVLEGGHFDARGLGPGRRRATRFLGWSVGPHWLLPPEPQR